jgi:hypothetical protein
LIPNAYLQEWSAHAPWPDPRQVEQDLIICRALCDLFSSEALQGKIAFRGGQGGHDGVCHRLGGVNLLSILVRKARG